MKTVLPTVPYTPEAELGVLGAAMDQAELADQLRLEWFHDLRHRTLAECIQRQRDRLGLVDAVTLSRDLEAAGVEDGLGLVASAQGACHSPAHFPAWASVLAEQAILREVLNFGHRVVAQAMESGADTNALLESVEREALAIRQHHGGKGEVANIKDELGALVEQYEQARAEGKPLGLATGFADLDRLIGGLRPGQLMVIAARPSVGKTAFALAITERVAVERGTPVAFFSLEMTSTELLHRLACSHGRIDGAKLLGGTAGDGDIRKATVAFSKLNKSPLSIICKPGLTLGLLAGLARKLVKEGAKVIIVDYLGLLRTGEKRQSLYEATTSISNALKALALELAVPVIALCQLNRENEREGRLPRMSDMRDSGAIEQDADIIGLLHRGDDQTGDVQRLQLAVAKNRQGQVGLIKLNFYRQFTRFEDAHA